MWELLFVGHVVGLEKLKKKIQGFIKTADEPSLRMATKIIEAINR